MCTFLSAIVMKNGDVLCDPEHTDSHEDLLAKHNIRDGLAQQGKFARVEFIPPKDHANIEDTSKWTFKVDEQVKPDWLDEERARSSLAARVKRMFVQDKRSILLGGCWILGDGADVAKVRNARIYGMYGSSKVGNMQDSSKVGVMCDSSKVGEMYGSSKVGEMCDSSKVEWMYGSSKVSTWLLWSA